MGGLLEFYERERERMGEKGCFENGGDWREKGGRRLSKAT